MCVANLSKTILYIQLNIGLFWFTELADARQGKGSLDHDPYAFPSPTPKSGSAAQSPTTPTLSQIRQGGIPAQPKPMLPLGSQSPSMSGSAPGTPTDMFRPHFPTAQSMASDPYAQPVATPRPPNQVEMYAHQHQVRASAPGQQPPDPYAHPPATPRTPMEGPNPFVHPPAAQRMASMEEHFVQTSAASRPEGFMRHPSPGHTVCFPPGPRMGEPYGPPRPPTSMGSSDPYAHPPSTPRPPPDPYAHAPATPRPQLPQDPYAHPVATPRPVVSQTGEMTGEMSQVMGGPPRPPGMLQHVPMVRLIELATFVF